MYAQVLFATLLSFLLSFELPYCHYFPQRLPSVVLLLNDILKYTDKKNEDYAALDKAISSLKGTMSSINECKRKTEGHMAMFDIINDIDNVPPYLLSSHRQFNAKVGYGRDCTAREPFKRAYVLKCGTSWRIINL